MKFKFHKMLSFILAFIMIISIIPIIYADDIKHSHTDAFESIVLYDEDNNKIIDFKNDSENNWQLSTRKNYNLKITVKRPVNINYVSIRLSGLENNSMIPNGIKITNPPGGTTKPGVITHDFVDKLVRFDKVGHLTYGKNDNEYYLENGRLIYHIKDTTATDTNISFEISFQVDESAYNNMEILENALEIDLLENEDDDTPIDVFKSDLPMNKRTAWVSSLTTGTITERDSINAVSYFTGDTSIYDKIEYDLVYPEKAVLNESSVSFVISKTKEDENLGIMSIGETIIDKTKHQKITHIIINHGYKPSNNGITIKYTIEFPNTPAGKYNIEIKNAKIKYVNNHIEDDIADSNSVLTIISKGEDKTKIEGTDENVYNHTNINTTDYVARLGYFRLTNENSTETPYEKIIEGNYNITNVDAQIKMITVPKGTSDNPQIKITGITESGEEKTVEIDAKYLNKVKKAASSATHINSYYVLWGYEFGFETIKGVYADIGHIREKEKSHGNTNSYDVYNNGLGVYGKFTSPENGIKVTSSFHIYNKDASTRNLKNGDLYIEASGISTDVNVVAMGKEEFSMINSLGEDITKTAYVPVGTDFTIKGQVSPSYTAYISKDAKKNKNGIYDGKSGAVNGTSIMIMDPIVYLILPAGFSYKNISFKMVETKSLTATSILQAGKTPTSVSDLDYTIENITYLNDTKDGATIYKITFPKGTYIGSYWSCGEKNALKYEVTLSTAESTKTGSYAINDLLNISNETGVEGAVNRPVVGASCNLREDKYGLNNGKRLLTVTNGTTEPAINLQGLSEVQVENSICVTKIDGIETDDDTWFTYTQNDRNSIALLGLKSEGIIRTKIRNTGSDPSKNVNIIIPIPKMGEDLGDLFMDEASPYTMNLTWVDSELPEGFNAKYVHLKPQDGQGNFDYEETSMDNANAILLHTSNMEGKVECEAYFHYTIKNEKSKQIVIFRTSHTYQTNEDVYNKVGNYIASEIANGTISGTVFDDTNKNGKLDSNESGISNIRVIVKDSVGRIQSRLTDQSGHYIFQVVREDNIVLDSITNKNSEYKYYQTNDFVISENGYKATKTYESVNKETLNIPMSNSYNLIYDANGGMGDVPPEKETTESDPILVAKNPDTLLKKGYEFKEWNTKADGTGISYLPNAKIYLSDVNCGSDRKLTLYAIWEEGTYEIILDYCGGTGNLKTPYNKKGTQSYYDAYEETGNHLPLNESDNNIPQKAGYIFKGWTTNNKIIDKADGRNSGNTTLYAIWKKNNNYKVVYDSNGGSNINKKDNVSWTDNNLLPEKNPTKAGYTFVEWQYEDNYVSNTMSYADLAKTEKESITLIAQWTPNIYPIKYLDNNTEIDWKNIEHPTEYIYGIQENLIEPPDKINYRFDGWYRDEKFTDGPISELTDHENINGDEIILYGKWTQIQTPITPIEPKTAIYKVEYYQQQTDSTYKKIDETFPLYDEIGKTVNAEIKQFDHYTLNETMSKKSGTVIKPMTIHNEIKYLTLKLYYNLNKHNISYDLNGGISDIEYNEEVLYGDTTIIKPAPTKENYEFMGWKVDDKIYNESDIITVTGDIVLTAQWKQISTPITPVEPKTAAYKVEHYKQQLDGTYQLTEEDFPLYDEIGKEVVASSKVYEHYSYNEEKSINKGIIKIISKNDLDYLTLKLYYDLDTYNIHYDLNGGISDIEYNEEVLYGDTAIIKSAPTRENYKFTGWKVDNKILNPNDTLIITKDITLTAQWEQVSIPITPIEPKTAVYKVEHYKQQLDGTYQLAEEDFPLYDEIGKEVVASSKKYEYYSYNEEKSINKGIVKIISKDDPDYLILKLYYDLDTYNIHYDLNGGTSNTKYDETILYGDTTIIKSAPTRENYKFTGWKTDNKILNPNDILIITKDITLTAQWEQVSTPITPIEPKTAVYKVEHYKQQLNGAYQLAEEDFPLYDKIGKEVVVDSKKYEHYSYNKEKSINKGIIRTISKDKQDYLTLKLYYDLDAYNIHYDLNGGTSNIQYDETILYGDTIIIKPAPTKENYEFIGWKYNSEIFNHNDHIVVKENITLIAQWKQKQDGTYKIEYYFEENGNYVLKESKEFSGIIGKEIIIDPKVYNGFKLNESKSNIRGVLKDGIDFKLYYDKEAKDNNKKQHSIENNIENNIENKTTQNINSSNEKNTPITGDSSHLIVWSIIFQISFSYIFWYLKKNLLH